MRRLCILVMMLLLSVIPAQVHATAGAVYGTSYSRLTVTDDVGVAPSVGQGLANDLPYFFRQARFDWNFPPQWSLSERESIILLNSANPADNTYGVPGFLPTATIAALGLTTSALYVQSSRYGVEALLYATHKAMADPVKTSDCPFMGFPAADYVLPAWYNASAPPPYDRCGLLTAPGQTIP